MVLLYVYPRGQWINSSSPSAIYMHQWIGSVLVQIIAPSHYLNQGWVIVIWTLRNKHRWNINQNTNISIHKNASEIIVCEMSSILSRGDESTHCGLVTSYGDTGSRSTLAQVMACCLMAPSHYLNQCWLMISEVLSHSPDSNFTQNT